MKTALTIAGSDCIGGAGIQADIKTMSALGVYGMSVITSIVAENTCRVISAHDVSVEAIEAQMDAIFEDTEVNAVKIGMISSREKIEKVAEKLALYGAQNVVIDPVMYAKDGTPLLKKDAVEIFIQKLLPLSTVLTPNIPEAEVITGMSISSVDDMKKAARAITKLGAKSVLVKGGHLSGDASDILYDGNDFYEFTQTRISLSPHGTGCTLSSAIASCLAFGLPLPQSVGIAKEYITGAIKNALFLGKGNPLAHHFYNFYDSEGRKL